MSQAYPWRSVGIKFLIASACYSVCFAAIGYGLSAQYSPLSYQNWGVFLSMAGVWGSAIGLVLGLVAILFKVYVRHVLNYFYFFVGGFLVVLPLLYVLLVGFGPTHNPTVYLRIILLYGISSGIIGLLTAIFALPRLPISD